jgi:dihydrofolate reductase
MITLIAACSKNRVIGGDNKLLWDIPEDLQRFRRLTNGNPIVMGRKTYESIGRPLPNRTNIILSKQKNLKIKDCLIYNNIHDVMRLWADSNLFVIGGGEIYKMFLPFADKIELTLIDKEYVGDAYFPELDNGWKLESEISSSHEDINFEFQTFLR